MILAAGLGTRLRPLTADKPKALVAINGKPLLEWIIRKLAYYGFKDIIINVHHFASQIIEFVAKNNSFNVNIQISDERGKLLDTGGGLKNAAWFLDDGKPFLLHNVDIISDIDLSGLYKAHINNDGVATLAVSKRPTNRVLVFNKNGVFCGWRNKQTGEEQLVIDCTDELLYGFSGIHVLEPDIFRYMDEEPAFSIIKTYLDVIRYKPVYAYEHDHSFWFDTGTIDNLKKASQMMGDSDRFLSMHVGV